MSTYTGPLVLVDGLNCLIRNYCVSTYLDSDGERAGGTTGMINSVRKMINDFGASSVIVVWDGEGGSQRRKSIYKDYKAGRTVRLNKRDDDMEESPEEQLANLRKQTANAKEYLTLLGISQVRCDGCEADDIIAYLTGKMDHEGGCVIVSTDQDMLQLIRVGSPEVSEVRVYSPVKKVMYDRQRFISDYSGVLPENFRLVKALTGDSSDNIDGVKGWGVKTIVKSFPFLTERRVTADEIMESAKSLKGVAGQRLIAEESRFRENLVLMDLSEPMVSATAARQARDSLLHDNACKEVEFRVRILRDGVSFGGDNLINPFREMVMRRRRMFKQHEKRVHDATCIEAEVFGTIAEVVALDIDKQVLQELQTTIDGADKQ